MKYLRIAGEDLPVIGFGTSGLRGKTCARMVGLALELGYRHIDTASVYGNEAEMGQAIAASGVDRGDIFLATKIWMTDLARRDIRPAAERSLAELSTDYVDLMLAHWPNEDVPLGETLDGLAALRQSGAARHIGVCNFTSRDIRDAIERHGAALFCNQVEYHARLAGAQRDMRECLSAKGVALVAYSPLARGRLGADATLSRIGARYGKSAAQVALRWLIEQDGVAAITRTSNGDHCRDGLDIFDFALDADDKAQISALDDGTRVIDPGWAPAWNGG